MADSPPDSSGQARGPRLAALAPFLLPGLWYGMIWHFSSQAATVSAALSDRILYRFLMLSSDSFSALPEDSKHALIEVLSFWERKAAHMLLYFCLAAFFMYALRRLVSLPRKRITTTLSFCALCAAVDEYHQTFVLGRSGEVRDILVDTAGAACFLLLWALWRQLRPKPPA